MVRWLGYIFFNNLNRFNPNYSNIITLLPHKYKLFSKIKTKIPRHTFLWMKMSIIRESYTFRKQKTSFAIKKIDDALLWRFRSN